MATLIPELGVPTYTLADFQASRTYHPNLCDVNGQDILGWGEDGEVIPGFLYDLQVFIEECSPEMRAKNPLLGKYHLLIERMDWTSDDLAKLERMLWADFYLCDCRRDELAVSNVDGSLDDFVVGICDVWGVEVNGDVWGAVFSDVGETSGLRCYEAYERMRDILNQQLKRQRLDAEAARAAESAVYFGA